MPVPASVKPAIWGAIGGAVAAIIIGLGRAIFYQPAGFASRASTSVRAMCFMAVLQTILCHLMSTREIQLCSSELTVTRFKKIPG
jgi:hypothetical protein